jgi:protein-L-isoaspartate(D-aspartate) O-methyltransferase
VERQLRARDIVDERVLAAMAAVPRHEFVPPDQVDLAYDDRPLGIGWGATISQPYIVALMTQLARVKQGDRVLDVGTGSGYQAAVLAQMGAKVFGIEIVEPLAQQAQARLSRLGYAADVVHGDGWKGRPEHAPYDAIVVAAAPEEIPAALKDQLRVGGRLVVPVGPAWGMQRLLVVTRTADGFEEEIVAPVAFVPLVQDAPPSP